MMEYRRRGNSCRVLRADEHDRVDTARHPAQRERNVNKQQPAVPVHMRSSFKFYDRKAVPGAQQKYCETEPNRKSSN
uniref:Uncharacterized protein n=1 Tax=Oryza sativa subsp. japonica TaxID=39947 RepID=Q6Z5F0_ORYSJ|nr:hypothetical protein [Oryza sativa Japonica Group]